MAGEQYVLQGHGAEPGLSTYLFAGLQRKVLQPVLSSVMLRLNF